MKLVAMADVFEHRLKGAHEFIRKECGDKVCVPNDRRFLGFDAYRKAMDCLKPGDVVILATPPGFRWVHFAYAVQKGLNIFSEKPLTVDGPTSRRFLALGEESVKRNAAWKPASWPRWAAWPRTRARSLPMTRCSTATTSSPRTWTS